MVPTPLHGATMGRKPYEDTDLAQPIKASLRDNDKTKQN
jgi:hypothetical protein